MDVLDGQGKPVHYSVDWEAVTFTGGFYKPGKIFRIYTETVKTMVIRGSGMSRKNAVPITLTEGYHNFVCQEIIEDGSDSPDGVFALF